jgi:MoxR-like ATPase
MAVARETVAGADAIYALHAQWLGDVLATGDSLFTPATPIWTQANLDQLVHAFIDRPNTAPGVTYLDKLQGQVGGASPGAIQLMAELHAVHFLIIWTGAISVRTKKGIMDAILAWMPQPPKIPNDVLEGMAPGFVHPGQWVMTRRDTQITWLIRFAIAWKALPVERRRMLYAEPWDLKAFVEHVDAPAANSARMGLLHLAWPDVFEPIVSTQHKELITRRFDHVAGNDPDVDRRLLRARSALTRDYGDGFNWYGDWLVHLWLKDRKKWPAFIGWLVKFLHETNGEAPPDEADGPDPLPRLRRMWDLSGWDDAPDRASEEYVLARGEAFLDELIWDIGEFMGELRVESDHADNALWALATRREKPDSWSDHGWEEFTKFRGSPIEATDEDVTVTEEDESPPPSIDYIAEAARKLHIDRDVLDEIKELLDDKGQVVLYGPPGTGKTHLAVELALALAEGDMDRMAIVQFHPATTYEDFFEGLRPRVTDAGQVTYQRTSGPLVAIAEKAAEQEAEDLTHVLVIDEINRANLPKVFGELLFLIEHRDKSARTLYRPEEAFRLPVNLKIIGTMNTADRSIALIDAAMRRRFHFVPFFPHDGMMKNLLRRWLQDGNGRTAIADFLDAVNRELLPLLGEHLLIGPSHFMTSDQTEKSLGRIWTYNIFPLIEEQLWGDQDQIRRWRWEQVKTRFASELAGEAAPAAKSEVSAEAADGGDEP